MKRGFWSPCADTTTASANDTTVSATSRPIGASLLCSTDPQGCAAFPTAGVHAGGSLAGNDSTAALLTSSNLAARFGMAALARHRNAASSALYAMPTSAVPAAIRLNPSTPIARALECSLSCRSQTLAGSRCIVRLLGCCGMARKKARVRPIEPDCQDGIPRSPGTIVAVGDAAARAVMRAGPRKHVSN